MRIKLLFILPVLCVNILFAQDPLEYHYLHPSFQKKDTRAIDQKPQIKTKPNIVFILADDQRNDMLSCSGHPIVKTPTIDKLSEKGVRFTNAFVTTSICMASRATIFTGLYETKHNYFSENSTIKAEYIENAYPYQLKKAGYNTGFVGKLGFGMDNGKERLPEMFDYYEISQYNHPFFIKQADGTMKHSAEVWGDKAVEYIRQQSAEKPFFLSLCFNSVHAVDNNHEPGQNGHYPYPLAMEGLYENIEMPKPRLDDPAIFENHPAFMKNSLNRIRYFWRWDTREKYQTNMRAYYRMISGYDNVMKRVFEELKKQGIEDNTVIIYSADNGYYMGNRGFAGKWSHYDESLRVPMIIYDPRLPENSKGKTSDKFVLNVDIPSTIVDLAQTQVPESYQGKSLLPLLNKDNNDWRTSFLFEFRRNSPEKGLHPFVGFRDGDYVFAQYYEQNPAYEYLHDLKKDPNQLINFVDNKEYQKVLTDMRNKCNNVQTKLKQ